MENLKLGHTSAAGFPVPELALGQLKDWAGLAPCQPLKASPWEGQHLRAYFRLKNIMVLRSGCTRWQHHGNPLPVLGRNQTTASMQYPAASPRAFGSSVCTNSSAVTFLHYLDDQMFGHAAPAWKCLLFALLLQSRGTIFCHGFLFRNLPHPRQTDIGITVMGYGQNIQKLVFLTYSEEVIGNH